MNGPPDAVLVVDHGIIEWSAERDKIAPAIVAAQKEMTGQLKASETADVQGREGKRSYSYKYADLAQVLSVIGPAFNNHGIAFMQSPGNREGGVRIETLLQHDSGQWARAFLAMRPESTSPQALGSTITYARRYAALAIAGIAPAEDDDGGAGSTKDPEPRSTRKAAAGKSKEAGSITPQQLERIDKQIKSVEDLPAIEVRGAIAGTLQEVQPGCQQRGNLSEDGAGRFIIAFQERVREIRRTLNAPEKPLDGAGSTA